MHRRAPAFIFALLLALLLAAPLAAVAAPLDRGAAAGGEKTPAKLDAEPAKPAGGSWLEHAMPAILNDKAVVIEKTTLVLIRDEAGIDAILVGKLYMVLVEQDIEQVAALAGAPQLCALPECDSLTEDAVAEAADRARLSIMRQQESGKATFTSSKQVREKGTGHRTEEAVAPVVEDIPAQPAALMNPPLPWWHDWVQPTTILGIVGTLIAGSTGWFAIQHQRHQMRQEQLKLATASVAPSAPAPAATTPATPKPRRSRGGTAGASAAGAPTRSRS